MAAPRTDNLYQKELQENQAILNAWWKRFVIPQNKDAIEKFRQLMAGFGPSGEKPKDKYIAELNEVMEALLASPSPSITFNEFYKFIEQHLPSAFIWGIDTEQKFGICGSVDKQIYIKDSDIDFIEEYRKQAAISGTFAIGCMPAEEKMYMPTESAKDVYPIHSIGKVFTGVLILKLVELGIMTEEDFNKPIKQLLNQELWNALPLSMQTHLAQNNITLHQVMTHKANLGNYLHNYFEAIETGLNNQSIPAMKQTKDFIAFMQDAPQKSNYSNDGIMIAGLVVQSLFEDKDYHEILQDFLLNPLLIQCHTHKPNGAIYNLTDNIAPHVVGGPSGGYWMSIEDLATFAQWLHKEYRDNTKFHDLMNHYGQEFCYPNFGKIAHDGIIPTASAHFAIYLKEGIIVVTMSNQANKAMDLGFAIKRHLFSDKPLDKSSQLAKISLFSSKPENPQTNAPAAADPNTPPKPSN